MRNCVQIAVVCVLFTSIAGAPSTKAPGKSTGKVPSAATPPNGKTGEILNPLAKDLLYPTFSCELKAADGTDSITGEITFFRVRSSKKKNGAMSYSNRTVVHAMVLGLPTGKHGIHIHDKGMIQDKCSKIGPHYNPFNRHHGLVGKTESHVGDLGNIVVNKDSDQADYAKLIKAVDMGGAFNILGRTIGISKNEDDNGKGIKGGKMTNRVLSRKDGNSGETIACCVIGIKRNYVKMYKHKSKDFNEYDDQYEKDADTL